MGLKTTSDEVEYQFLLDDGPEQIKAKGNISYYATSSEVFLLDPVSDFGRDVSQS